MDCHVCMIDTDSTVITGVSFADRNDYVVREYKKMQAGINMYRGPGKERAIKRLASFLTKKKIRSLVLAIHPDTFYPLDTYFPADLSGKDFDSHCRTEATFLFHKPENYCYDHIPYTRQTTEEAIQKHLLFYYSMEIPETLQENLHSCCALKSTALYLTHLIRSIAAASDPFVLLEIDNRHATCSAGNNGALEYFSYWQMNHHSDAEYFALRELLQNPKYRSYPVYMTGSLTMKSPLATRLSEETNRTIQPLDPVSLFKLENGSRFSSASQTEIKALCTAFTFMHRDAEL